MKLFRRLLVVSLLICLGCSAQSVAPDVSEKIERQMRAYYNVPPSVKISIGPLQPSEFSNYSSVSITMESPEKKHSYDFLLSKDGKTLIRFTKLDLDKDPYADNLKKIDTAGRPVRGNRAAKVVVVNFDDLECPFCSRMHQTLFPTLLKEYGDRVAFIYMDFPLTEIHPWATHAAVDANCLAAQNGDAYWDFADFIHNNQHEVSAEKPASAQFDALDRIATQQGQQHNLDAAKLQACFKAQNEDAIKAGQRQGEALGIEATPTMFINGQQLDGAVPIAQVRAVLDAALKRAGVPLPADEAASLSSGGTGQPAPSQPPALAAPAGK